MSRIKVSLGISTFERPHYLQQLLGTFASTCSREYDWVVVVSDDGSSIDPVRALEPLRVASVPHLLLRHGAWKIAALTNSLMDVSFALDADVLFKIDDDLRFLRAGWDVAYLNAIQDTGFEHLVFYDAVWRDPQHRIYDAPLQSLTTARNAQGAMYTITREVFSSVGYVDEINFWGRGYAHLDFTRRCCLAGFNDESRLWDVADSGQFVRLAERETYVQSLDWEDPQVAMAVTPLERRRRAQLVDSRSKPKLTFDEARLMRQPPQLVEAFRISHEDVARLESEGLIEVPPDPGLVGLRTSVLNLRGDRGKWSATASQLRKQGLAPERTPAHDGRLGVLKEEWREYEGQGLVTDLDVELGRKALASPGAWGYMSSARQVLIDAIKSRSRMALLCDDDTVLSEDMATRIGRAIRQLPDDWMFLYAGWTPRGEHPRRTHSSDLLLSEGRCNGSFAVLISSNAYSRLLQVSERYEAPFDEVLRSIDLAQPGKSFVLEPPAVMPVVKTSAIRNSRSQIQFVAQGRWAWEEFSSAFDRHQVMAATGNRESHTLLIQMAKFSQRSRRLAALLASAPWPDLRVVWVAPMMAQAASHLKHLLLMDPRAVGVLVPSGATFDLGVAAQSLAMGGIVVTSEAELQQSMTEIISSRMGTASALRRLADEGLGRVLDVPSPTSPVMGELPKEEPVRSRIPGVLELRAAELPRESLWLLSDGQLQPITERSSHVMEICSHA